MSLGEDEAVPLRPARVAGPGPHFGKKQGHQDIGGRQGPPQVPGTGAI